MVRPVENCVHSLLFKEFFLNHREVHLESQSSSDYFWTESAEQPLVLFSVFSLFQQLFKRRDLFIYSVNSTGDGCAGEGTESSNSL